MHIIKIIFFITLYVASCAFTISCSVWGNKDSMILMGLPLSQWSFFLPSLLIFLFGIRAYINGRKSFSKITYASNELYLLGYLGTIVSVVTLVFIISFGRIQLEKSFNLITQSVCLALTTTLVGLIGMFTLKLVSHSLLPPDQPDTEADKIQTNMHPETAAIKSDLSGLALEIHKASDAMSNLKKQTSELSDKMGKVPKSLEPLDRKILELMNHFQKSLQPLDKQILELMKHFQKLHKTFLSISSFKLPKEVIQSMEKGFVGIEKVYKSLLDFNTTLENVNSSTERIMDTELNSLKGSFQETANVLIKFKKGVKDIDSILTDFADLQKKGITNEKDFHEKRIEVLASLSENLVKLTKALHEMKSQSYSQDGDGTVLTQPRIPIRDKNLVRMRHRNHEK